MTFRNGGWVLLVGFVVALATVFAFLPRGPHAHRDLPGDGRTRASYGFDLSACTVDSTLIAPAGIPRDGIPSLDFPALMTPSEADDAGAGGGRGRGKYLVSSDRVIGVTRNGQARAYPLRVVAWHEVVNDTLGGVPICVTYSPISDGALAFDRRKHGRPVAFGHAGLLYNHSLLLYDRGTDDPSLWSQLLARAVAGPAVGDSLPVIPFQLTHWATWRHRHPDTRVLRPRAVMVRQYEREPYGNYFGNDRLRDFPLAPRVPDIGLRNKARVLHVGIDGRGMTLPLDVIAAHVDPSGRWRTTLFDRTVTFHYEDRPDVAEIEAADGPIVAIPSFWFARYAVSPRDSLYPGFPRSP